MPPRITRRLATNDAGPAERTPDAREAGSSVAESPKEKTAARSEFAPRPKWTARPGTVEWSSLETTQWGVIARAKHDLAKGDRHWVEDRDLQRAAEDAGKALWPYITVRPGADVLTALYRHDDAVGTGHRIPRFDLQAVVEGRRSLLSLGEGDSGFVAGILRDQRKLGVRHPTAHAADAKLPTRQDVADFPGQYHQAFFQDLDLRASNGRRLAFEEIIASHSVTRTMQIALPGERRKMLQRAVDHLAPGGVFRAWPVDKSIARWLRDELGSMKKKGVLAQTVVHTSEDDQSSFVIIQKK